MRLRARMTTRADRGTREKGAGSAALRTATAGCSAEAGAAPVAAEDEVTAAAATLSTLYHNLETSTTLIILKLERQFSATWCMQLCNAIALSHACDSRST